MSAFLTGPMRLLMPFVAVASLTFSTTAYAGLGGDASFAEVKKLRESGANYQSEAMEADQAGIYSTACGAYRNAAAQWSNAIYASLGMMTDPDYDRSAVEAMNESVQEGVDLATKSANEVCGLTDDPHGDMSQIDPDEETYFDEDGAAAANQETIYAASKASQAGYAAYEAGDMALACENSKKAAFLWQQAQAELKLLIEYSGDTGYDNPQMALNVQQSAEDQALFCR